MLRLQFYDSKSKRTLMLDTPRISTPLPAAVDTDRVSDADRAVEERGPFGPEGEAWGRRLDAEILRVRWTAGEDVGLPVMLEAWRGATDAFAKLGQVYEEARSTSRLSSVLHAAGDIAGAKQVASAAHGTAVALRADPLVRQLEQLAGATAVAGGRMAVPQASAGEKPLTAREREVLALIADGLPNKAIAREAKRSRPT